jgi:hypothetical protein
MTIAGWILVIATWGSETMLPSPYSSHETCIEAAKSVDARLVEGEHFICVPIEAPNIAGQMKQLLEGLGVPSSQQER